MPEVLLKDDFNNLMEYQSWLKPAWDNLSSLNEDFKSSYTERSIDHTIRSDPNWLGRDVTFKELANGVSQYKDPQLIESIYNKVANEVSSDIINRIKSRKLRFNSIGLGIFCFDRAAMTLYRTKTVTGAIKVKTATKELFAWFPQESRDRHAMEMYVSCDAPSSATANNMLYGGISAIIISELLVKAGIRVKINIVIGSALSNERQKYVGCVIPIKNYDEPFDRNLTALLTSDPRFMRYDALRGVIAAFDYFSRSTPSGMGYAMNGVQLRDMFEKSGYVKKSQAQHRYYFGGTLSEEQALRDVTVTINDLASKLEDK